MNKIQDGYASFSDSYKPVTISLDRQHYASISFVGEQVIVRPGHNAQLVLDHAEGDSLVFRIAPRTAPDTVAQTEPNSDVAQDVEPTEAAPQLT